jgi:small subunit ribosomal protein S8
LVPTSAIDDRVSFSKKGKKKKEKKRKEKTPFIPTFTMSILNVANMASHLCNASKANLGITSVKNTKYNLRLAMALHRSGFVSHVYRAGRTPPTLDQMASKTPELVTNANVADMRIWLAMKYWDGKPVLSKVKMVSTPKRLMTVKIEELAKLTRGFPAKLEGGVVEGLNLGECMYLGTDKGLLEAREALTRKIGGLLLCRAS